MCGIGGIVKLGKRPIRKWQLKHLATELQHRGTDATGFALMDEDGAIHTWKMPCPAWKAIVTAEFNEWADKVLTPKTQILLVHTRQYTKGSPHINENNHPLYAKPLEGVVVHNGMVRNDDALFDVNKKLYGFQRSCATDSDIFRAILDNHRRIDRKLIEEMGLVEGTAAVAAIHKNSPGRLLLLRDSNPLVLGATADTIAFASTKEALHKVLKPWIKLHNLPMQVHAPDLSFVAMRDQTGYIIDAKASPPGLVEHEVFKCNGRGSGGYVKYTKNTDYHSRQKRAAQAALTEQRFVRTSDNNPSSKGTKVLVELDAEPLPLGTQPVGDADGRFRTGQATFDDPRLFEFTICPNEKCSRHVELSEDDRRLSSIALLACGSCGSNLAGGQNAGFVN